MKKSGKVLVFTLGILALSSSIFSFTTSNNKKQINLGQNLIKDNSRINPPAEDIPVIEYIPDRPILLAGEYNVHYITHNYDEEKMGVFKKMTIFLAGSMILSIDFPPLEGDFEVDIEPNKSGILKTNFFTSKYDTGFGTSGSVYFSTKDELRGQIIGQNFYTSEKGELNYRIINPISAGTVLENITFYKTPEGESESVLETIDNPVITDPTQGIYDGSFTYTPKEGEKAVITAKVTDSDSNVVDLKGEIKVDVLPNDQGTVEMFTDLIPTNDGATFSIQADLNTSDGKDDVITLTTDIPNAKLNGLDSLELVDGTNEITISGLKANQNVAGKLNFASANGAVIDSQDISFDIPSLGIDEATFAVKDSENITHDSATLKFEANLNPNTEYTADEVVIKALDNPDYITSDVVILEGENTINVSNLEHNTINTIDIVVTHKNSSKETITFIVETTDFPATSIEPTFTVENVDGSETATSIDLKYTIESNSGLEEGDAPLTSMRVEDSENDYSKTFASIAYGADQILTVNELKKGTTYNFVVTLNYEKGPLNEASSISQSASAKTEGVIIHTNGEVVVSPTADGFSFNIEVENVDSVEEIDLVIEHTTLGILPVELVMEVTSDSIIKVSVSGLESETTYKGANFTITTAPNTVSKITIADFTTLEIGGIENGELSASEIAAVATGASLIFLIFLILLILLLFKLTWNAISVEENEIRKFFVVNKKHANSNDNLINRELFIDGEKHIFSTSVNERRNLVLAVKEFKGTKKVYKFVFKKTGEKDIKIKVINNNNAK